MQTVILAAGLGTRMGELTKDTPKPLLKIGDKTLLEHNLESLPDEVDEVVLVVGYLQEKIREKFGDNYERKKITYVEQKELKGTAHALWACKDILHDRFLVFYGDDLYGADDLKELVQHPLAILVWEMGENEISFGPATVKIDSRGNLAGIAERQPLTKGSLINTGAYVLDERIFDYPLVSAGDPATEFGLPQTIIGMVKEGAAFDIVRAKYWHRVSSGEDLM